MNDATSKIIPKIANARTRYPSTSSSVLSYITQADINKVANAHEEAVDHSHRTALDLCIV